MDIVKCYLPANALGLVVPGKFGEASIIYFLKKKGISVGQGTAVFAMEKIITLMVVCLIALFGFFVFFSYDVAIKMFGIMVAGGVVGLFVLLSNFGRGLIKKYFLRKYQSMFTGFSKTIFSYLRGKKGVLLLNTLVTFLRWVSASFVGYLAFLIGFNVYVPFYQVLMVNAIGSIVSLIPISISGLGVRQGTAVYLYGLLGVGASVVAGRGIILLVTTYLFVLFGGLWWWRR